ncbi:TIGR04255 family protein [Bradyrhizobium sp. 190]|uniref:TIGR04255 family protein n=1 Tax=Bradyrhizobium sp. 190 TaxID=2782658 RepID=UPI001FFA0CAC|nr:TIGR04255 family protein [Bradyrhizobium sp. 190]MCK1517124.1 TIGR04255 family protein [Bradyrhizobium sp. 190]
MSFRPINDDHAVQSATFAIALNRPLAWSSIEALIKSSLDWRKELPAIDLPQTMEVQINPQTGTPVNRITRGVEFSHKRPDGSASWQLDVLGSEIRVTTTLYTRWAPTCAKAGDILLGVAGQLAMLESARGLGVLAISLHVADVFATTDEKPDYSELFARNDRIPLALFSFGRLWHTHSGWFMPRPAGFGSVLNQLNIDARTGTDDTSLTAIPDTQIRIIIQHNQIYRPTEPINFGSSGENALVDAVLREMPQMHQNNKAVLRDLLTPSMQQRIKVNV